MKYSLLYSNLEHFLKLFANLLDQSKDTQIKGIKMAATRFSTTLSDPQHPHHCLHFGSLGALSWTSWVRKAEKPLEDQIRALSCSAKAWQGCSQEQPISQHLGI